MICGHCKSESLHDARYCGQCAGTLARPNTLAPPPPDAERRHITVLFCDLVGSTEISTRLEPEDVGDVLHAYHEAAIGAVRGQDGYVAQVLGDGVLAYFCYPVAHEDSAVRALRAALRIVDAVRALGPRFRDAHGAELRVRVGVHTGAVVISDYGDDAHLERLAVGEAPNLAARVQSQAEPDQVLVTDATWRLSGGFFRGRDLGLHPLRGIPQPVRLYELIDEAASRSSLLARPVEALTPFVGRARELEQVAAGWAEARGGGTARTLLLGEPGIGKSRHVQVLKALVAGDSGELLEGGCTAGAEGSALRPIAEMLRRRVGAGEEVGYPEGLALVEQELQRCGTSRPDAAPCWPRSYPRRGVPVPAAQHLAAVPLADPPFGE